MNLKFYFEKKKVEKEGKHYTNYSVVVYTESRDGAKRIISIIPVKPSFYKPSYYKILDLISHEVK